MFNSFDKFYGKQPVNVAFGVFSMKDYENIVEEIEMDVCSSMAKKCLDTDEWFYEICATLENSFYKSFVAYCMKNRIQFKRM